jgi:hypothetical protein
MSQESEKQRRWIIPATIFVGIAVIFLLSPIRQHSDSRVSILLSENLLHNRSFMLDEYLGEYKDGNDQAGSNLEKLPYQLEIIDDHIFYYYPPGSSILSVPLIGLANLLGFSSLEPDGRFDLDREREIGCTVAAILMAGFATLVYCLAITLLSNSWSVLISLATAFGTQVWSTASRALWSHDWMLIMLCLVVWHLLGAERSRWQVRPALLATLLALAYFTRPTSLLPLIAVGIYLLLQWRKTIFPFVATLAVWFCIFFAYSWYYFGTLLPSYFTEKGPQSHSFIEALLANLISPARGLLVFLPHLLFLGYLLVRYRRALRHRAMVLLSLAVCVLHWVGVSSFHPWWAGHAYGPRLMTDILPWIVVLTVLGVKAWQDVRKQECHFSAVKFKIECIVGTVLLILAVSINGGGAFSKNANMWNAEPRNIDRYPSRVWNWEDPQCFAWLSTYAEGRPGR